MNRITTTNSKSREYFYEFPDENSPYKRDGILRRFVSVSFGKVLFRSFEGCYAFPIYLSTCRRGNTNAKCRLFIL